MIEIMNGDLRFSSNDNLVQPVDTVAPPDVLLSTDLRIRCTEGLCVLLKLH